MATTHLVQLEARLALNPRVQLIGSYQRDTAGNIGLLNARLAREFLPLSFLYVVFTDSRTAFGGDGMPLAELAAYSEQSRLFSAGGNLGVGRYFRSDFVRAQGQLGFSPLAHLGLFLNYELNRFEGDGVIFESRVATTHLVQLEARLALNPRVQLIGSYQRDTAGNIGLLNARLAWEFLPLSFLYVVLTDSRTTFGGDGMPLAEQRLVVKATWTWRP